MGSEKRQKAYVVLVIVSFVVLVIVSLFFWCSYQSVPITVVKADEETTQQDEGDKIVAGAGSFEELWSVDIPDTTKNPLLLLVKAVREENKIMEKEGWDISYSEARELFWEKGDTEGAIRILKAYIEKFPYFFTARKGYQRLGSYYEKLGKKELAQKTYRQGIAAFRHVVLSPEEKKRPALIKLGFACDIRRLYSRLTVYGPNHLEEEIGLYQAVIKEHEEATWDMYNNMISCYIQHQHYDDAIGLVDKMEAIAMKKEPQEIFLERVKSWRAKISAARSQGK